ncbi:MDR family oxidoreductase [Ignatzschineria larvae DSM 13226]|uniref:MDR family oxidoreductase n=1 Tax=Ignatzschineria larvae DSM 13226 TaxID=1111732 RepID=A0ABZ3BWN0_9GAMM|nr:MDR family oxidoreductase [Ignatzschineria larvae]
MFQALYLDQNPEFSCQIEALSLDTLKANAREKGDGDTLVKIYYSTLNYKDALAVTNKGRIARRFPMIPGIDFVGEVVETTHTELKVGDLVFMNGLGLSENHFGGLSEYAFVPGRDLLQVPESFTAFDVMALGTAGYTAGLCINRLLEHGIKADNGEVLVSGATGGVGMVALMLLGKLGFKTVALTRKADAEHFFEALGVSRIEQNPAFYEKGKVLQKEQYQAAVDVLGGHPLANILAQTQYSGIVAACGLASDMALPTTVAPFILRDVTLAGVDSVMAPKEKRVEAWALLSRLLTSTDLQDKVIEIPLSEVTSVAEAMISGTIKGRFVVKIA